MKSFCIEETERENDEITLSMLYHQAVTAGTVFHFKSLFFKIK